MMEDYGTEEIVKTIREVFKQLGISYSPFHQVIKKPHPTILEQLEAIKKHLNITIVEKTTPEKTEVTVKKRKET